MALHVLVVVRRRESIAVQKNLFQQRVEGLDEIVEFGSRHFVVARTALKLQDLRKVRERLHTEIFRDLFIYFLFYFLSPLFSTFRI